MLTLAAVAGKGVPGAVKPMLSEFITHQVMKMVNWTGQGDKLALKDGPEESNRKLVMIRYKPYF